MVDNLVIVPSDGDGYVQLARHKTGRLFRKHLLSYGKLRHPTTGADIEIDEKFAKTLKSNFDAGVCDIVQVPLANAKNEHTEAPERNIGEVVDVEVADGKIFAILDVRDPAHADRLGKTYLGASAMMHLDYTDNKTGQKVGPTLLHACVTNRPYVTGLDSYQEIVEATSDTSEGAVVLAADSAIVEAPIEETTNMPEAPETTETTPVQPSLEDLLSILKTEHGIDVAGLQAKAAEASATASLTEAVTSALTEAGVIKLTNTEDSAVSTETVVSAIAELAGTNVTLTDRVKKLELSAAQAEVEGLVAAGRIMPSQREGFVELRLTNAQMFDALVPAEPVVAMTVETGVTPPQDEAHAKDIDAEVARLSALLSTTSK